MAQHLAQIRLDSSGRYGRSVNAYVGKTASGELFPTDDWDEAFTFSSRKLAAKAATAVKRKIRSAAAGQH